MGIFGMSEESVFTSVEFSQVDLELRESPQETPFVRMVVMVYPVSQVVRMVRGVRLRAEPMLAPVTGGILQHT